MTFFYNATWLKNNSEQAAFKVLLLSFGLVKNYLISNTVNFMLLYCGCIRLPECSIYIENWKIIDGVM